MEYGENYNHEKLHNVYSLIKYYEGDQINEDVMDGACSMHEVYEKCIQNVAGKPDGRPRHRWT